MYLVEDQSLQYLTISWKSANSALLQKVPLCNEVLILMTMKTIPCGIFGKEKLWSEFY